MKSVFISYSTDASKRAKSIGSHLETMGISSFIFEKNLAPDSPNHQAEIRQQIERCKCVILVLSTKSKDSSWVSHELGMAKGLNKRIYVFKTSHNLKLPNYIDLYDLTVFRKLSELSKLKGY